jgi:thiamine biosynthesis lipoprotein
MDAAAGCPCPTGDDSGGRRRQRIDPRHESPHRAGERAGDTCDHPHVMIRRLQAETFRAMGTSCAVAVTAGTGDARRARRAIAAARSEVAACERELSRFDPESDLSRLNGAGGEWAKVGTRLRTALRAALNVRAATGGLYDPTVLPALIAAGYDRTFDELREREPQVAHGWHAGGEVEIDVATGRVRLEPGVAVDLGGIGKGWSAGRAVEAMSEAWPALGGALADLGGDIALAGTSPEGGPWRIAVADPRGENTSLGTLHLPGGSVATSGRDRRRFGPGRGLHHLIDPQTGTCAAAEPLTVTLVGHDPAETEAHATALALGTHDHAAAYLRERPHLAALLVPDQGPPVVIGDLPIVWAGSQGAAA